MSEVPLRCIPSTHTISGVGIDFFLAWSIVARIAQRGRAWRAGRENQERAQEGEDAVPSHERLPVVTVG